MKVTIATKTAVKKEPPALFCGGCRTWFETQEKHNSFSEVDGAKQALTIWRCPACRGVEGAEAVVARAPETEADHAKDDRMGPYRAVRLETLVLNAGGKSAKCTLECGHTHTVLPYVKRSRCRKCLKAAGKETN